MPDPEPTASDAFTPNGSFESLVELAYAELQQIARGIFRAERRDHTLQPTALVHEAIVRLRDARKPWHGRDDFVRAAVSAMRRVLIDHARAHAALKRGGDRGRAGITMNGVPGVDLGEHVLELDEALAKLEGIDERRAQVAGYRLFGGLENKQIARLLDVSESTASDDWTIARAWLAQELAGASS
ncbi:MAG: ECF-type sigma factor [Planctomycetota bacterium]